MDHITAFQLPCNEQQGSCLFDSFPGEVRDKICTFVLNCYESKDPAKIWNNDSSFVRPGYSAPLATDSDLLRTCQQIYAENWFRPWVSATHSFYLAWQGRRPDDEQVMTVSKFQPVLDHLFAAHGEVEISHVRVFAQLCSLEDGRDIAPILRMPKFFPVKLTVTIRHHDWWNWESDNRLHIGSSWVEHCRFPNSLREICVEIESLQRKKNQIDWIANEMVKNWHFKKTDGKIMSATSESCQVSTWSGSSTWQQERWLRDETKPGVNEYYVKTITWKSNENRAKRPRPRALQVPDSFPVMHYNHGRNVRVSRLERAGIPGGLPADETLRRVEEWEARDPDLEVGHTWHIQESINDDNDAREDDQEASHGSNINNSNNEEAAGIDHVDGQGMTQDAFEEMLQQWAEDGARNDEGDGVNPIDQDMTQEASEEHSESPEHIGSSHHSNDDHIESIHESVEEDIQNLGHHGSEEDDDDDGGDNDYSDSNVHDDDDDGSDDGYESYWSNGTNEDFAHSDEEFEEEEEESGNQD